MKINEKIQSAVARLGKNHLYKRAGLGLALVGLVFMLWADLPLRSQSGANSNAQILLSGTGLPAAPSSPCTPWGLWVWSQPQTNNAYGNDGEGYIYFYHVPGQLSPVSASNVVLSGNSVSEDVTGSNPDLTPLSCNLQAHQTSPGKGILDKMSCTIGTGETAQTCTASDLPITVNISNGTN